MNRYGTLPPATIHSLALMKLIYTFLMLFLLTAHKAFAISESEVAVCAAKSDPTTRLSCYDALAESMSGEAAAQDAATSGDWLLTKGGSPGGKENDLELSLLSGTQIQVDKENVLPVLSVSCLANKVAVKLNWKINLGRDSIRMRTRFDNRSHRSSIWNIDNDFQTVTPRGSDISFIKQLMRHDKLTVEITPSATRPVSAEFNIYGLEDAILPLTELCRF